jgi:hypothetical protein
MAARNHPLLGKWRIVEAELWDTDFLDLVEPAYISFDAQGRGAFVFGAVQGGLHCRYGPDSVRFTWEGFDEMDHASGAGDAELDERWASHGRDPLPRRRRLHLQARRW